MLTARQKKNVIKATQRHDTDTGSTESQVALLTRRIDDLASHLKKNAKDAHSRRGLLKMVATRRSHLVYLAQNNPKAHKAVTKKLGLKK